MADHYAAAVSSLPASYCPRSLTLQPLTSESNPSQQHHFMITFHDVTPNSWQIYQPFIAHLDQLFSVKLNLLIVPNFHHQQDIRSNQSFIAAMQARLAQGDELILHGFYHQDESPAPTHIKDYLMRHFYTVEGEFYSLSLQVAQERLATGLEYFAACHFPTQGFVAPAWLMSEGTRIALSQSLLTYTSDTRFLYLLPNFQPFYAPTLVWSARTIWRNYLSWAVNQSFRYYYRNLAAYRLGLHPIDFRYRFVKNFWLNSIDQLLQHGFKATTKSAWLNYALNKADLVNR